jgi:hypothetical protein
MSEDMMPKRWSVGNYDGYMVEWDGGDYVEAEDVEPLVAEITRLRARVEVLEAVLHAIFPDGANIKLVPKANAEEAKP